MLVHLGILAYKITGIYSGMTGLVLLLGWWKGSQALGKKWRAIFLIQGSYSQIRCALFLKNIGPHCMAQEKKSNIGIGNII